MPVRFAVKTGVWSDTTVWDSGALPVAGDTVYPNGFGVTIDTDISVASLNNNGSNVILPAMSIPAMTDNTQPSGIVTANVGAITPWYAFDQNSGTLYNSGVAGSGFVAYQFSTQKTIRSYRWAGYLNGSPKDYIFQGSNNGTAWDNLDTVTGNSAFTALRTITSPAAYFYYRLIATTTIIVSNNLQLYSLEMTESTGTVYGGTSGGSFTVPASLSGNRTITQTGEGIKAVSPVVTTSHISGNIVNFNTTSGGYILNPNSHIASLNNAAIQLNGNGAVNFNGNIWGSQTVGLTNVWGLIYINNNAIVTINGNVYAGKGGSSTYKLITTAATTSNSCVLNINGDIIGSNYYGASYPIAAESLATTNIVGNLTSDLGNCYYSLVASFLNLTGTATVTNSNSQAAIYMSSTSSLLTLNGSIINKNNINTIWVPKIRFASTATPYWIYQTNAGTDMALSYGTPVTGPYPAEADVRYNTPYGASPTRYGTLRVPLPTYVSQGVLTDNTIGTAYLDASDVWNVLTSTITVSGSIGERLKNASTVQTTGDQIASYQV